jgi:tryptophan synthase alpha chain
MTRISRCFAKLQSAQRKALIPYVTAGDPRTDITVPLMHAMVKAGADILELGIPFSDPMADGPVIQRASERALAQHMTLHKVLAMVAEFRREDDTTPVVLMGYLNPLEAMGYQAFARAAHDNGVDGILIVDLPPEEAQDFVTTMHEQQLETIFLVAPTTSDARIASICSAASGFVYYVSLKGVTGAASLDVKSVAAKVAHIRKYSEKPIGVGFGIKDAATAAQIARIADAVIVGSALVRTIEDLLDHPDRIVAEISAQIAVMRKAMDEAGSDEGLHKQMAGK